MTIANACSSCREPLRAPCPSCGWRVAVEAGKVRAHDAGTVHGGHMTWGACPGSGKRVAQVDEAARFGGVVERANNILYDALADHADADHVIQCHAEDVPRAYKSLSGAALAALEVLQEVIRERVGGE